jgi:hypothetical protein
VRENRGLLGGRFCHPRTGTSSSAPSSKRRSCYSYAFLSNVKSSLTCQSKVAIYVVSFNYTLEKVVGFTRIPLRSITSIQKGAYILSTLQEAGRDPLEVSNPERT